MSAFLGPLVLSLHGAGLWITREPLRYQSDVAGREITVPKDLITDLASIPRRPIVYLLLGGHAPGPGVVHDFLYSTPDWDDRQLADAVLYEAMGCDQAALGYAPESTWVRWSVWSAVRLCGWWPWRNDKARAKRLNPLWTRDGWPEHP